MNNPLPTECSHIALDARFTTAPDAPIDARQRARSESRREVVGWGHCRRRTLQSLLFAAAMLLVGPWVGATFAADDEDATGDGRGSEAKEETHAAPRTHVVMTTSMGDVIIKLDAERAPLSVENFLAYVDDKAYDGTIFHRVIPNFMIQGGGFNPDMTQRRTRRPIRNEASNGVSNRRGTIAMARTNNPHSATNQFFINVRDNANLDYSEERRSDGYAVFGEVVHGMDVVDNIRVTPTQPRGVHLNVPVHPIVIERIVAIDDDAAQKLIREASKKTNGPDDGKAKDDDTAEEAKEHRD